MYISPPRKNKDGSISYTLRCSIKTANGFQSRVKTVHLPLDHVGKIKATKDFLKTAQDKWKKELSNQGMPNTPQNNDILFIDLERQYKEELLLHNPTGYTHYNSK